MEFVLIQRNAWVPDAGQNTAYLKIDHWNDFAFVTMFQIFVFDENSIKHDLGSIKVGFRGQTKDISTHSTLGARFDALPDHYFSVGLDFEYYRTISSFSEVTKGALLTGLNDIVSNAEVIGSLLDEDVFKTSLLRDQSLSVIRGQYRRVLDGGVPLTDFDFSYRVPTTPRSAGIDLEFEVSANSKPSTNIQAIIGRNGVGKTTTLNGMVEAITNREGSPAQFFQSSSIQEAPIGVDYFSSLVSVSFSAFDPFTPPQEQPDPTLGPCYFCIGIKAPNAAAQLVLKSLADLQEEFVESIVICMSQGAKRARWLKAISTLEFDENFAEMALGSLGEIQGEELRNGARSVVQRMSSGHAVVMLTITRLVATVEEKTLVLIDEPESHLHPPLLSAFTRALSELLHDRNGVAIVATHSPVVLQEVPASCVWKVQRSRLNMTWQRPDSETFGENVGTLTREVFGLEVVKSGFMQLLGDSVASGEDYDNILASFEGHLGYEGRAILKAMIQNRNQEIGQ